SPGRRPVTALATKTRRHEASHKMFFVSSWPMNLYEQQTANRRKTWLIMFAFVAFLFVLGLGFDTAYLGDLGGSIPIGSILALGVGSVSAVASYYSGDKAVLLAT